MSKAIKQYNWRGELIAYSYQNESTKAYIPIDSSLHYYRELIQNISEGSCVVEEPIITCVEKSYNRNQSFNGYLYQGMFIPLDPINKLYQLIERYIKTGICLAKEPPKQNSPLLTLLKVCIFFDSPWKCLKEPYTSTITYPIQDNAKTYGYKVCFFNLQIGDADRIDFLNKHYSINNAFPSLVAPHQIAVLEITIPINKLRSIFRIQKKYSQLSKFVLDQFEMHICQTERSQREGPSIDWLINFFPFFAFDTIADIGNRAIDAITLETHEEFPKYISEKYFVRNHIIYSVDEKGAMQIRSVYSNGIFNDFLSGDAQTSSYSRLANNPFDPMQDYFIKYEHIPLLKIKQLATLGMTTEAISILNAYLEVSLKRSLAKCILWNPTFFQISVEDSIRAVYEWGHRKTIEILREFCLTRCFSVETIDKLESYITIIEKIYKHRNLYIHDLTTDDDRLFLSHSFRKNLESLLEMFIDPYRNHQFSILIDSISANCKKQQLEILYKHILVHIQKRNKRTNRETSVTPET